MTFDTPIDRRGSGSAKWDRIDAILGYDDADAIAMWIAQMDFAPAACITHRAEAIIAQGEYGYFTHGEARLFEATRWWLKTRHGYDIDPSHCLATHGLGNAIGLCLQALTAPGDGVIVFSPVYSEFSLKIRRNGREVIEAPLGIGEDGRFVMDLDALETRLTGREKLVLFSAPHNPAGRIWTAQELSELAAFADRHDLVIVSDEIHQDIVMPSRAHLPFLRAVPEVADRLVLLTAASKTFNLAGLRTGVMTVPNDALRARLTSLISALDIQPNRIGVELTEAAYSPEGAAWTDALCRYLDDNRRLLTDGLNAIRGVHVMPTEATFLAWVDFSGTGLDDDALWDRITKVAQVVPTPGAGLGAGSDKCHRLNFGTQRAHVQAAVERLQAAFA